MAEFDKIILNGTTYNIPEGGGGGITGITMNGSDVTVTSGVADLGTVVTDVSNKQDTLVSGTNIKTINNESILGSGNITIQGGGGTQQQADWNQTDTTAVDYIKNKPTLATVATSGDYDDLSNKPTIPIRTDTAPANGIEVKTSVTKQVETKTDYVTFVSGNVYGVSNYLKDWWYEFNITETVSTQTYYDSNVTIDVLSCDGSNGTITFYCDRKVRNARYAYSAFYETVIEVNGVIVKTATDHTNVTVNSGDKVRFFNYNEDGSQLSALTYIKYPSQGSSGSYNINSVSIGNNLMKRFNNVPTTTANNLYSVVGNTEALLLTENSTTVAGDVKFGAVNYYPERFNVLVKNASGTTISTRQVKLKNTNTSETNPFSTTIASDGSNLDVTFNSRNIVGINHYDWNNGSNEGIDYMQYSSVKGTTLYNINGKPGYETGNYIWEGLRISNADFQNKNTLTFWVQGGTHSDSQEYMSIMIPRGNYESDDIEGYMLVMINSRVTFTSNSWTFNVPNTTGLSGNALTNWTNMQIKMNDTIVKATGATICNFTAPTGAKIEIDNYTYGVSKTTSTKRLVIAFYNQNGGNWNLGTAGIYVVENVERPVNNRLKYRISGTEYDILTSANEWVGTQAQYNALGTYDENITYYITE